MSGVEPIRRKTTHLTSANQLNHARRMGDLVKVGQKLTSENLAATTNPKTASFIVEEEKQHQAALLS